MKLPVFNPESSKLLLEIQLTSTGAVTLDGAKNLSLNIKTTGAFGNLDNNQTIKFRRNRDYKETVEVNISDRGEGSVSITFLSLDSQHFREEIQKYTYKVYAIDQAAYLGNLSQNTVETSADLVRENARVYDLFKHFLNFPKEFQTQSGNASTGYNYNSVITVLRSSEDAIRSCYQNMSSPPQSLGKAVNLFKVFGQPELAGLSQTRSYYGEAVTQLGRAEDEFFKQSDNETSILRLEDRANEYQKLFCELRGYNCRYKKKYSAQIENLIEQWANGSGNKSDYCETWRSEIRISAYYDSHDKDRRFVEAAKKCDSDPCSGAANYSRIKNIETLVRLLASCRENKCGEETCREIEEKINQLNCLQQLARAKAETNLGEKRSLLGQIIQNAACSEAIAEAKKLLEGIQPLKIIKEEGPETGRNEITGGKLLIFTLYFDSGKDIRLQLIDSLLAEPILAEGHVKLNWVEKDRILKIQVEDREEDYQLVFGSESTGEEVPYQLSKKSSQRKYHLSKTVSSSNCLTGPRLTMPDF